MAFFGCLLKRSGDATLDLDPIATLAFDGADVYDTHALHDPSSDNTKIIIPAALNGRWAILKAGIVTTAQSANASMYGYFLKNASASHYSFGGRTRHIGASAEGSTTSSYHYMQSLPILLSSGDEFELQLYDSDASVTVVAAQTWFCLQGIDSSISFQGVLATRDADETTADYTTTAALAFDGVDAYDTHGAHDPASDNSKIIVPAAWNGLYGVPRCCLYQTSFTAAGSFTLSIRRDGSSSYDGFVGLSRSVNLTQAASVVEGPPLLLTTGQEFEAWFHNHADTSVTIEAPHTTFGLQIVG